MGTRDEGLFFRSLMRLRFVLREPLLHFLFLGSALFFYEHWTAPGAKSASNQIVLTSGQIEHLLAGFTKTWRRPANEAEVKGIIDDWLREELAVRAATEAKLDRGDTIIRRRLRQKFEFLVEDVAGAAPPSDEELTAWFAKHAEAYRGDARLHFRQVFFSKERRGEKTYTDAASALERLGSQRATDPIENLGDGSLLPESVGPMAVRDIKQMFGDGFADQIVGAAPGSWSGPVVSGYGVHLILVSEHIKGSLPDLAAVRPAVERDYVTARRKEQLDSIYAGLLEKFTIVIEGPEGRTLAPAARKGD